MDVTFDVISELGHNRKTHQCSFIEQVLSIINRDENENQDDEAVQDEDCGRVVDTDSSIDRLGIGLRQGAIFSAPRQKTTQLLEESTSSQSSDFGHSKPPRHRKASRKVEKAASEGILPRKRLKAMSNETGMCLVLKV